MNAYITNGNPYTANSNYGYGNYGTSNGYGNFGYGNYGTSNGYGNFGYGNPTLGNTANYLAPADAYLPQGPQDSVMLSGDPASGNFNFGVQDTCSCQFGNGASQEAFIVPAGDQDNPFGNDLNATAMEVPALNGQNPQQALMALLEMLGITPEMVQALQAQGINLLDLIAQANGMECLGGCQTGQEMVLPTTMPATGNDMPAIVYMPVSAPSQGSRPRRARPAAAPAPAPAAPTPAPPAPAPPAPARPTHTYEREYYVGNGRRVR
jgi:hypothetical protein